MTQLLVIFIVVLIGVNAFLFSYLMKMNYKVKAIESKILTSISIVSDHALEARGKISSVSYNLMEISKATGEHLTAYENRLKNFNSRVTNIENYLNLSK